MKVTRLIGALLVGLDNPIHLAFLLVILLLVFGAKRLPEMGRSLGSGLRGFKEAISGDPSTERHMEMAAAPEQLTPAAEDHTAVPASESAASAITSA